MIITVESPEGNLTCKLITKVKLMYAKPTSQSLFVNMCCGLIKQKWNFTLGIFGGKKGAVFDQYSFPNIKYGVDLLCFRVVWLSVAQDALNF